MAHAASVSTGPDDTEPGEGTEDVNRPRRPWTARRRLWWAARAVAVAVLGYVSVKVVVSNSAELSGSADSLGSADLRWVALALVAEALSYAAFTQLERRLLAAGGLRTRFAPMAAVAVAGNAINGSLPGGGAFATVFAFHQFRRRGADEALTTWTLVAFTALTAVTLAALSLVGLLIAGSDGPVAGLWPFIPVLMLGPVAGVAILLRPHVLGVLATPVLRVCRRLTAHPRAEPSALLGPLIERLQTVTPRPIDWAVGLAYATTNWLMDCSCLVLAFWAVGASVPWRGLLVAYCAAQVAANLPITPGGLGVVEGSLAIALVSYGGATDGSVAAVLLYRIMSFWAVLPIGWSAWLGLSIQGRRARRVSSVPPEVASSLMSGASSR